MGLKEALTYIEKVVPKNGYDKQYARMIATRVAYLASDAPQPLYDEDNKETVKKESGSSKD